MEVKHLDLEVEVGEGSDKGDVPAAFEPSPSPPPGGTSPGEMLQIPPRGSGARLGFLLGVGAPSSGPRGAQGGGARDGLPPTPVAGTGGNRKRGRTPVASCSSGGGRAKKKGKNADADKHAEKAKSPVGTSESVNNISDDEEDDVVEVNLAPTRKLTSEVWLEMTKKLVRGVWKAYCNYCNKPLSAGSKSGTSHLRDHLKICTQRVLKLKGKEGKIVCQSNLRMTAQANGKVNVDSYTFDQDTAREELGNMIVLHDYPLSIVDHAGFRRFIHAVQPNFNLHTRNTIRKDIIGRYDKEKKKAIDYMTMIQSRVAVTTDMWTADNQKKGYMAVTGHFVDESWKLRILVKAASGLVFKTNKKKMRIHV